MNGRYTQNAKKITKNKYFSNKNFNEPFVTAVKRFH